jgi:hypothetical protein
MSTSLVQGLLVLAFLPYAALAVRDELLHRRARRVSRVEQVLHLCVAVAVFAGVSAVFRRDVDGVRLAAACFVGPALLDEFVCHRDIPAAEHAVHARQHLALFVFAIASAWALSREA